MMSAFRGSAFTSAKSLPRPQIRPSVLTNRNVAPASSLRYSPPFFCASANAYTRFESLGATEKPMRPSPSFQVGRPSPTCFHVLPPSVDLKSPLPGPLYELPTVHGGRRADQTSA